MATIARSTAGTITGLLNVVSTTAGVLSDTVGVIGSGVNGAALKVNDWHYEQKARSVSFRDSLDERIHQEDMERTKEFAKEVRKTQAELKADPELQDIFNQIVEARRIRAEARAEAERQEAKSA